LTISRKEIEMDNNGLLWICTECGHTSSRRFPGDICPKCGMTYWMCDDCGYTTIAAIPPDPCPECGMHCHFTNITCYVPELGTPKVNNMQLNGFRDSISK
jgi:rubrerythrin